ncbi:hypothetical protein ES703_115152 [subsurface metagenome]
MGAIQWLVYILSFLIPPLGFITFWVFAGKQEGELKRVAQWSLTASFIGVVVYLILASAGISLGWVGIGMEWIRG